MPMKRGSGNLDFGSGPDSDDEDTESETGSQDEPTQDTDSEPDRPVTQSPPAEPEPQSESTDDADEDSSEGEAETNEGDREQFPYFVRRSNVGDERDERIEVHLRKSVHSQESAFRSQLADELGTEEISKTDAREFALKFAFENPEGVAELMREEGFGLID